jgi:hypothetical protein
MARRLLCGLGMNKHTTFASIDLDALNVVTGGADQGQAPQDLGTKLPRYMSKAIKRYMRENAGSPDLQVVHRDGKSFIKYGPGTTSCVDGSRDCYNRPD